MLTNGHPRSRYYRTIRRNSSRLRLRGRYSALRRHDLIQANGSAAPVLVRDEAQIRVRVQRPQDHLAGVFFEAAIVCHMRRAERTKTRDRRWCGELAPRRFDA